MVTKGRGGGAADRGWNSVGLLTYLPFLDLDGDYYWGTWDPKLFPQKEETPLSYGDYKHPAEVEVDPFPPVQQEEFTRMSEIRSYFSKFAILNELGVISNRRLVHCLPF